MIVAPAGSITFSPTSAILPSFTTTEPLKVPLGHGHDGGVLDDDGLGAQRRDASQQLLRDNFLHRFPPGSSSVAAAPRPPRGRFRRGRIFLAVHENHFHLGAVVEDLARA